MGVAATRRSPQAERYETEGHWEGRLLDALVRDGAAAWPQRVAVVDGTVRLTYRDLATLVERAAGALHALGVRRGDVVSFQLPNWWEAAVVHHATLRLGAVSNAIVPIYRARELRFIARQSRAKVLVVPGLWRGFDHAATAAALRDELESLEHVVVVRGEGPPPAGCVTWKETLGRGTAGEPGGADDGAPSPPPPVAHRPSDAALLLYTSGTEADPKGVIHSHETALYESRSIARLYDLGERDRVLMPSPVTHVTGLVYGLQMPFLLGSGVVLQERWEAERALDLIERERCSVVIGATPFLHGLASSPTLARRDLSSLRS